MLPSRLTRLSSKPKLTNKIKGFCQQFCRQEDGSATVELALCMMSVVLLIGVVISACGVAVTKANCYWTAGNTARIIALSPGYVDDAQKHEKINQLVDANLGNDTDVNIDKSDGVVIVTVTKYVEVMNLRTIEISAESTAYLEQ
jgi:Flp pilus assembly protein TadG